MFNLKVTIDYISLVELIIWNLTAFIHINCIKIETKLKKKKLLDTNEMKEHFWTKDSTGVHERATTTAKQLLNGGKQVEIFSKHTRVITSTRLKKSKPAGSITSSQTCETDLILKVNGPEVPTLIYD